MSNNHRGNTQPQIDNEEHVHINGIGGKKVYNIDSAGNVVNFSGVSVYQATIPWASVATIYQGSLITVSAYGANDILQQDDSSDALLTIDFPHHEVHEGDHYYIKGWFDIPSSATISFLFVTPNTTKWPHVKWEIASEAEAEFTLYEGGTVAANGSAVTIWNNNRNSINTSAILAYSTPSITTLGTNIYAGKLGSGRTVGGGSGREHEMIGKQNTKYIMTMANNDGTAARWVGWNFYWYEHTNNA